jgi:hypothetical protein
MAHRGSFSRGHGFIGIKAMFAIVRTGGKQYRVAPGDKIVVEKLAGSAGDSIDLTDVLLAGEGSDLKSTSGLIVAAEIIAKRRATRSLSSRSAAGTITAARPVTASSTRSSGS